jgi:hypothetical protein
MEAAPFGESRTQAFTLSLSCKSFIINYLMVPKKGLEPPHPCEYMDLNHARLPIPPLRLGAFVPLEGSLVEGSRTAVNGLLRLLSLQRETAVNQLQRRARTK